MPGKFVTVEGTEGAGKSTIIQFIAAYLREKSYELVTTREPGGTPLAESIRQLVLTPLQKTPDGVQEVMQPATELLLMFAGRAQHLAQVIQPALAAGKWVICDRFIDASYAYQGAGRQLAVQQIAMLDQWIVGDCLPDLTLLLDVDPAIGLARAKQRGVHDRIEQEKLDFFTRIREAYLVRARQFPARIKVIDSHSAPAVVQAAVRQQLDNLLECCV